MTHDGNGNLLTRREPDGATTTYTYGPLARLETSKDALGRISRNTYDDLGNLQTSTDAAQHVTTYGYGPGGLPTTITRPGGATTTLGYDPVGNVTTMTDPENGTTTLGYDTAGHLTSMRDPETHTRTMEVDARGQLRIARDARNKETKFEYDDDGNRTRITAPDGAVTEMTYDQHGRVVATKDPLGNMTRQQYDAEGRLIARIDARGFRTTMQYDPLGRLVATRDAAGFETRMAYCAELSQQPCAVVDALGNVSRIVEDEHGREVERQDPLGNVVRTEYDLLGRRTAVVDPTGKLTTFDYDEVGRLKKVVDARSGVTLYGYDPRGNRTSVKDAKGNETTFGYDLANRLVRERTPIGMVTEFTYDKSGNRVSKKDGKNQLTSFAYDANRRLMEIAYAGGVTPASFEYDDEGNRLRERNGDHERRMTYDVAGRLATVFDVPTGRTITYGYDATGNRTSMKVMPDNETTTYAWDGRGLLSRMTDPEGGVYRFTHDALGRRTGTSYPNGMTLTTTYDAASRVLSMVYRKSTGQVIESFTYTYDTRGNRTSKIFADGTAELYGYDELSRLVRATYPSGRTVEYRYDAVGNRMQMMEGTAADPLASRCAGDGDCDGVADASDNCPSIANPGQADGDATSTPGGLVAGFNFEESSSSFVVKDVTGRNDGVNLNAGRVPGKRGLAASFPKSTNATEMVRVPESTTMDFGGKALTLAAWVKPDPFVNTNDTIINKAGVYTLQLQAGATDSLLTTRDPTGVIATSTGRIPHNQWSHVALTYDGTKYRFYINGTLDSEVTRAGTLNVRAVPAFMGCDTGWLAQTGLSCFTGGFDGLIDELGVWARVLSAGDIATLMNSALTVGDGQGDACDACPGNPSASCAPVTCQDRDGDGFGPLNASACSAGQPQALDCNDGDPRVKPGGVEACDGLDNDCDGRTDEACVANVVTTNYTYNGFNQLLSSGVARVCPGDADCDGVLDAADNCPAVANATQTNSDANTPRPAATGALGFWKFEEASGTTTADATGAHPGTLQGGVTRKEEGRFGRGLEFDGVDDQVTVPGIVSPTGPRTFMAWVKHAGNPTGNHQTILDFGTRRPALTMSNNTFELFGTLRGGAMPLNAWTHVAYTWDGTTGRMYVNGQQAAQNTTPPFTNATGMGIGFNGNNFRWKGEIDEVGVFTRALTPAEVQAHATERQVGDPVGDACDPCINNPDPACAPTTCTDTDNDGYGPPGASACSAGQVAKFDCNDNNAAIRPGVELDVCDGADNDCDGRVDEDCGTDVTYEYDGNGNRARKVESGGDTQYLFDSRDRVVEIRRGGSTVATYRYDTQNIRTSRDDMDGARLILVDGLEDLAEYQSVGPNFVRSMEFLHDPTSIDKLLRVRGTDTKFVVNDALGSVYREYDKRGSLQNQNAFDAFGAATPVTHDLSSRLGFAGRYAEPTGLIYARERYYEPAAGQWISGDPLGPFAGPHGENSSLWPRPIYGYVGNRPVTLTDPLGLFGMSHHEEMTFTAFVASGIHPAYARIAGDWNGYVDWDQFSDYKHGMRESGGFLTEFSNLIPGVRCSPPPFPSFDQNAAEAYHQADDWIAANLKQSDESMCTGDRYGSLKAIGMALHTVQDRRAHLVRETMTPATAWDHCRKSMHSSNDPWLWVADYEAMTRTVRMALWWRNRAVRSMIKLEAR